VDAAERLAPEPPPFIRISGLTKAFGGVDALSNVSFEIRAGVTHGLVGANGAGKSTLIRCLAGINQPDAGSVEIDGQPVTIANPDQAAELGLAFIHQEMSLIPGWDVLRNMALGSHPATRFGIIDWRATRARATDVAEQLGMTFSLSTQINDLSTAEQWLVLIGRALMRDARLIAMDEPTASLSAREAERLHAIVRSLVEKGTTVLFVSHRLDEVADLCTDVTVFKDGKLTKHAVGEKLSKPDLVRAIVGKDIEIPEHGEDVEVTTHTVLDVRGVSDGKLLNDVSLSVHAGEIVGLGGLVGSGRSELVKIIYGAERRTAGEILLGGTAVNFTHPAQAVRAGVGFVPEERRSEGLFIDRSIGFNINVSSLSTMTAHRFWPFLRPSVGQKRAQEAADRVTVKARNVTQVVEDLSGGNQQKVAIARWLISVPRLLILDEPSRGVDVGARAEVHDVIRSLAASGCAVLVVSSDNEELVSLCSRVVVLNAGRVSGTLTGSAITVDHLVHRSFSEERETIHNDHN
jgi:ribose transport system ATP-binding protein